MKTKNQDWICARIQQVSTKNFTCVSADACQKLTVSAASNASWCNKA